MEIISNAFVIVSTLLAGIYIFMIISRKILEPIGDCVISED